MTREAQETMELQRQRLWQEGALDRLRLPQLTLDGGTGPAGRGVAAASLDEPYDSDDDLRVSLTLPR